MDMLITVGGNVALVAEVDTASRRWAHLSLDDGRLKELLIGLAMAAGRYH